MSLRQQLWIGFGVMLALVLTMGSLAIWTSHLQTKALHVVEEDADKAQALATIKSNFLLSQQRNLKAMMVLDTKAADLLKQQSAQSSANTNQLIDQLKQQAKNPGEQQRLDAIIAAREAYRTHFQAFQAKAKDQHWGALELVSYADEALGEPTRRYDEAIQAMLQLQEQKLAEDKVRDAALASTVRATLVSGMLGAVLLAIGISLWIIRSVFRTLGGEPAVAAAQVSLMASGDLSEPCPAASPESLLGKLETMRTSMGNMIARLTEQAQQLASFSEELATAAQQVAGGAQTGSDAASSMAASVEEMSVSIAHVADSAGEAAHSAAHTGELAQEGSSKVLDLAASMSQLSGRVQDSAAKVTDLGRQSDEIRSIVSVIKDIADQTNLLALNAAIEAARAGETGRGFAVVADEVRKLAERTTQSTQDIARKIESIQGNVKTVVSTMNQSLQHVLQGEQLAGRGVEAIRGIQAATAQSVGSVRQISIAIQENSSTSHAVAQSVEHIAQLSEENAGAALQVSSTANALTELAEQLNNMASQFKTAAVVNPGNLARNPRQSTQATEQSRSVPRPLGLDGRLTPA